VSTLPTTWVETYLGDVVPYGATVKAEPADLAPDTWVLELEDIEKDTTKVLQRLTFSERQSKSTKNRFDAGDVLYGKLRPYLNKVTFAKEAGVCTTEIVPIKPNDAVNGRYLFHWLRHPKFLNYVTDVSHGVNMPRLGTDAGRLAPFVLAPKNEQKRIADKLDTVLTRVDAVNTRLARVAPLLKRFRQSVLSAATSGRLTEDWRATATAQSAASELVQYLAQRAKKEKKPPALPDMAHWKRSVPANWTIASVQQFAECLDRLRVPIKRDQRQSEMGLYPYYGANGEVGRIDQFIFDDELVLVTEDETFYGREKPIAYRSSGKCWVNNHAHVLRAPSKAANDYLCFSLMYYDVVPWLSGTTGRAKLTQQALNSLPIAVPPALEISEIVRRVETLFAFADRLEARLQTAQTAVNRLTPSLLAKAFRGELAPQDPNDEPAAELLKRLVTNDPTALKRKRQSLTKTK
jgi:type I restriction enzyme S subunit